MWRPAWFVWWHDDGIIIFIQVDWLKVCRALQIIPVVALNGCQISLPDDLRSFKEVIMMVKRFVLKPTKMNECYRFFKVFKIHFFKNIQLMLDCRKDKNINYYVTKPIFKVPSQPHFLKILFRSWIDELRWLTLRASYLKSRSELIFLRVKVEILSSNVIL